MAKSKANRVPKNIDTAVSLPNMQTHETLSNLKEDSNIWYKVQVLLYDLRNLSKDPASKARTLCTTDELYLNSPYFTPTEAGLIKATVIEVKDTITIDGIIAETEPTDAAATSTSTLEDSASVTEVKYMAIEEAIKSRLENFFEKRKASGDSRPCGPHDMAPIYQDVFGISSTDLQDERFLGRLRRNGLDNKIILQGGIY